MHLFTTAGKFALRTGLHSYSIYLSIYCVNTICEAVSLCALVKVVEFLPIGHSNVHKQQAETREMLYLRLRKQSILKERPARKLSPVSRETSIFSNILNITN